MKPEALLKTKHAQSETISTLTSSLHSLQSTQSSNLLRLSTLRTSISALHTSIQATHSALAHWTARCCALQAELEKLRGEERDKTAAVLTLAAEAQRMSKDGGERRGHGGGEE
mmetsp:Transcript_18868/g.21658  ORF Transcript_18868/g.21658 Transcript_18868/m.21658 type:complete len:113 (-) Transcript_18868:89-427(-)